MNNDYLEERRRYIQQVRNSFAKEDSGSQARNIRFRAGAEWEREEEQGEVGATAVWKVKIILSVMLFAAFVLCDRTDSELFSLKTETIVEKIGEDAKIPPQVEETLKNVMDDSKQFTASK